MHTGTYVEALNNCTTKEYLVLLPRTRYTARSNHCQHFPRMRRAPGEKAESHQNLDHKAGEDWSLHLTRSSTSRPLAFLGSEEAILVILDNLKLFLGSSHDWCCQALGKDISKTMLLDGSIGFADTLKSEMAWSLKVSKTTLLDGWLGWGLAPTATDLHDLSPQALIGKKHHILNPAVFHVCWYFNKLSYCTRVNIV